MSLDVVKLVKGGLLRFFCPGCNESHTIRVNAVEGHNWSYNGNPVAPTFTPSVLVRAGHYAYDHPRKKCWCNFDWSKYPDAHQSKCYQCHSFVTDGQIQFLSDCTHELAGKTVPLPPWPEGKEY